VKLHRFQNNPSADILTTKEPHQWFAGSFFWR